MALTLRLLGIKLFFRGDEKYEIEHVLSEDWWDDGAWDYETV
jgi:hypothetical protein